MKYLSLMIALVLSSCAYTPEIAKSIEEIATDDGVSITVDKEAFKEDTDVRINIDILNKDASSFKYVHPYDILTAFQEDDVTPPL